MLTLFDYVTDFVSRATMTSQGDFHDLVGTLTGGTWTKPTCPCCTSLNVEPLVLIQLAENVDPVTKKWIISRLEAPVRDGGEQKGAEV